MFIPFQIHSSKKVLIALIVLFLQIKANAQEETVIDNKGNIVTVKNNMVTTSATAPISPVDGDVWFDTASNLTKIYDGIAWLAVDNLYTTDGTLLGNRTLDADGNGIDMVNIDRGYNIEGGTTGVGETATNSSDGALLHIRQETGWSGAGPWALFVEGYTNLNGFRINAADGIRSLYTRSSQLGFATEGNVPITFTQNDNDTRLSILADGELQFHEYGGGTITGTPTKILGVELDGDVVEVDLPLSISTDTGNSIATGTDSGIFYESPIKAFGKIAATGTVTRATTGVTVTKLAGNGHYRVNLPVGVVSDDNYIIQLSQPGRGGAGNDDPGISYSNQTATSFEVIIGDNDNGGTDRARFNSEFMFTVLDL